MFLSHKFQILTAALVLSLVIFSTLFWMELGKVKAVQSYGGYFFCLSLLAFATYTLWQNFSLPLCRRWLYRNRHFLLACIIFANFLHLHEPHQTKIFQDEPSHILISKIMHEKRMNVVATRSHWEMGSLVYDGQGPSFRMYLFPFAVSIFHDLWGFGVANAFLLNYFLTYIILIGLYALVLAFTRNRWIGLVSIILFSSLPLLAQTVTSASYDILNLACQIGFLGSLIHYWRKPGKASLNLSISSGLLLAYCRNEASLYLLLIPVLFFMHIIFRKNWTLSWPAVISPIFLIGPISAYRIYQNLPNMDLIYGIENKGFFGLQFFQDHLAQTVFWLFQLSFGGSNSWLLSILGSLALIIFLSVGSLRIFQRLSKFPSAFPVLIFSFLTVGLSLFFMAQFWSPADPAASRLLLPLHLVFTLSLAWFFTQLPHWSQKSVAKSISLLTIVFIFLLTIPINANSFATRSILSSNYYHQFLEWIEIKSDTQKKKTLYITSSPLSLIYRGHATSTPDWINRKPANIIRLFEEGHYDQAILFRLSLYNPKTGNWTLMNPPTPISSKFKLRELKRFKLSFNSHAEIFEITAIEDENGEIVFLKNLEPKHPSGLSEKEYYNYIRSLH